MDKKFVALFLLVISFNLFSSPPHTFQEAKKMMYKIYSDHRESVYCHCLFDENKNTNYHSCGYIVRKDHKRAEKMEAEHIVPAWLFGHELTCWKEKVCRHHDGKKYGGRKCCRNIDAHFREMENDLYNLAPAVGEINADRSDYPFHDWQGSPYQYGQCQMLIDFHGMRVQPPLDEVRGFIARSYLHMHQKYHIKLSEEYLTLIMSWSKQFPKTSWEQIRHQRIQEILNS